MVVGEPPEDQQSLDCVDIGYATVNAKQLLRSEKDLVETSINGKNKMDFSFVIFFISYFKYME